MMIVTLLPILDDNYCYILQANGQTAIVDPGDAAPVIDYLEQHKLIPLLIFNTHNHWDHINGNGALIDRYGCRLFDPAKDHDYAGEPVNTLPTPGHTKSHVCFYFPESQILFSGDTLFAMGCGRIFDGTAAELFQSLQTLKSLPDDTLVYCGHEYTIKNIEFARIVMPDHAGIEKRFEDARALRAKNLPTLPFRLGDDKVTNPFLLADTVEAFSALREQRNRF